MNSLKFYQNVGKEVNFDLHKKLSSIGHILKQTRVGDQLERNFVS